MKENQDRYYTELDKNLQDLAALDWPTFVNLVGETAILAAKICLLKRKGRSYNQMATKLNTTKHIAEYRSKQCDCN